MIVKMQERHIAEISWNAKNILVQWLNDPMLYEIDLMESLPIWLSELFGRLKKYFSMSVYLRLVVLRVNLEDLTILKRLIIINPLSITTFVFALHSSVEICIWFLLPIEKIQNVGFRILRRVSAEKPVPK